MALRTLSCSCATLLILVLGDLVALVSAIAGAYMLRRALPGPGIVRGAEHGHLILGGGRSPGGF